MAKKADKPAKTKVLKVEEASDEQKQETSRQVVWLIVLVVVLGLIFCCLLTLVVAWFGGDTVINMISPVIMPTGAVLP